MLKFLRSKLLAVALTLLALLCVPLAIKSSADPLPRWASGTWLEAVFLQFPTGNQFIFDLALGVIVSLLIYVLVVRIPEYRKRQRHRDHLLRRYVDLKKECIMNFLFACNGSANMDLVDTLTDRDRFKAYFSEKISPDQGRWHAVLNGLNATHIKSITGALADFRREVEFSLTAVSVDEARSLSALRQLTRTLHAAEAWTTDYDDVKALSTFMWRQHTGWSVINGYTDRDAVEELLAAL